MASGTRASTSTARRSCACESSAPPWRRRAARASREGEPAVCGTLAVVLGGSRAAKCMHAMHLAAHGLVRRRRRRAAPLAPVPLGDAVSAAHHAGAGGRPAAYPARDARRGRRGPRAPARTSRPGAPRWPPASGRRRATPSRRASTKLRRRPGSRAWAWPRAGSASRRPRCARCSAPTGCTAAPATRAPRRGSRSSSASASATSTPTWRSGSGGWSAPSACSKGWSRGSSRAG